MSSQPSIGDAGPSRRGSRAGRALRVPVLLALGLAACEHRPRDSADYRATDLTTLIGRYADPHAGEPGTLNVTFLGTTSLLFDDGRTQILIDGFFSRPRARQVIGRMLTSDGDRIYGALARAGETGSQPSSSRTAITITRSIRRSSRG